MPYYTTEEYSAWLKQVLPNLNSKAIKAQDPKDSHKAVLGVLGLTLNFDQDAFYDLWGSGLSHVLGLANRAKFLADEIDGTPISSPSDDGLLRDSASILLYTDAVSNLGLGASQAQLEESVQRLSRRINTKQTSRAVRDSQAQTLYRTLVKLREALAVLVIAKELAFDEVVLASTKEWVRNNVTPLLEKRYTGDRQTVEARGVEELVAAYTILTNLTQVDLKAPKSTQVTTMGPHNMDLVALPYQGSSDSASFTDGVNVATLSLPTASPPRFTAESYLGENYSATYRGNHSTVTVAGTFTYVLNVRAHLVPNSIKIYVAGSVLRDSGIGTMVTESGWILVGASAVNYESGTITLEFDPLTPIVSDLYFMLSYECYLISAAAMAECPGGVLQLELLEDNTIRQVTLNAPATHYGDTALAFALDFLLANWNVSRTAPGQIIFWYNQLGSCARAALPVSSVKPAYATGAEGPYWASPPTYLNDLLTFSTLQDRGEDVGIDLAVLTGDMELAVASNEPVPKSTTLEVEVALATPTLVSDAVEGAMPGVSSVRVLSPYTGIHRVQSVDGSDLTLDHPISLPFADDLPIVLETSAAASIQVETLNVRVSAGSAFIRSAPGLDAPAESTPSYYTALADSPRYKIRSGDYLKTPDGALVICSKDANTNKLRPVGNVGATVSSVVGAASYTYDAAYGQVAAAYTSMDLMLSAGDSIYERAVLASSSNRGDAWRQVVEQITAIQEGVLAAYQAYKHQKSTDADALLEALRSSNLDWYSSALERADFRFVLLDEPPAAGTQDAVQAAILDVLQNYATADSPTLYSGSSLTADYEEDQ